MFRFSHVRGHAFLDACRVGKSCHVYRKIHTNIYSSHRDRAHNIINRQETANQNQRPSSKESRLYDNNFFKKGGRPSGCQCTAIAVCQSATATAICDCGFLFPQSARLQSAIEASEKAQPQPQPQSRLQSDCNRGSGG